eukprot:gene6747-10912_t
MKKVDDFGILRKYQVHTHRINEVINLEDNQFCSIGEDKTTIFWDFDYDCINKRFIRENYIRHCVHISRNKIISHDLIGNFIITNLKTYEETNFSRRGLFTSSVGYKQFLILCGATSITYLNTETFQEEENISLEEEQFGFIWHTIIFKKTNMIFVTSTGYICIFDLERRRILNKFHAHEKEICKVFHSSTNLIISCSQYKVKFWDDKNFECVYSIKNKWKTRSICELKNQTIAFGCSDGIIRLFDVKSMKVFRNLKGHDLHVECLILLRNGFLLSGSDDEKIIIWKIPPFDGIINKYLNQSIQKMNFVDVEFKFKPYKRKRE